MDVLTVSAMSAFGNMITLPMVWIQFRFFDKNITFEAADYDGLDIRQAKQTTHVSVSLRFYMYD